MTSVVTGRISPPRRRDVLAPAADPVLVSGPDTAAMLGAMEMAMNAPMEPIFRAAAADSLEPGLPPELEELVRAGLAHAGGRLVLLRPEHRTPPPGDLGDFESISLQSAPGAVDPTIDFAAGAVHLALIRSPDDDFAPRVEGVELPVLTMTATAR